MSLRVETISEISGLSSGSNYQHPIYIMRKVRCAFVTKNISLLISILTLIKINKINVFVICV
jgi:hypothetical protein